MSIYIQYTMLIIKNENMPYEHVILSLMAIDVSILIERW